MHAITMLELTVIVVSQVLEVIVIKILLQIIVYMSIRYYFSACFNDQQILQKW